MQPKSERDLLLEFLRGDHAAVLFCENLFQISQILDDLIDKDEPVDDERVLEMMWRSLFDMPNNPFYRQHFDVLNPMMRTMLVDWMDANALEKGGDHEKTIAFVLRDSIGAIVVHAAYLVGGYSWGRTVGPDVRRYIFDEKLKDYKRGLTA